MTSPWMEYGNAREFVRQYPDVDRLKILLQIARGLRHLHTFNPAVVHGDLKAANIVISRNGRARIADFGLSRWAIDGSSAGNSTPWRVAGNPRWQAPELIVRPDDELPRRTKESDMFAFGRVIIEIYTGELPFSYLKDDYAVLWALLKGTLLPSKPIEPEVISRGLDDQMWRVVKDCSHKHPSRRLTVSDVVSQLKAIQEAPGSSQIRQRFPFSLRAFLSK